MVGSACGIASWLAYAKIGYGEITVDTTGFNLPLLTGNVVSLGLSLLITVVGSLVFPDKAPFNWEELNSKITKTEDTVRTCNALLNYLIYLNPIWAVLQRWLSPSRMRSCESSGCFPDFQKLQESLLKGRACIKPQYAPCLPPCSWQARCFQFCTLLQMSTGRTRPCRRNIDLVHHQSHSPIN